MYSYEVGHIPIVYGWSLIHDPFVIAFWCFVEETEPHPLGTRDLIDDSNVPFVLYLLYEVCLPPFFRCRCRLAHCGFRVVALVATSLKSLAATRS